jgi:hypothetical protein
MFWKLTSPGRPTATGSTSIFSFLHLFLSLFLEDLLDAGHYSDQMNDLLDERRDILQPFIVNRLVHHRPLGHGIVWNEHGHDLEDGQQVLLGVSSDVLGNGR